MMSSKICTTLGQWLKLIECFYNDAWHHCVRIPCNSAHNLQRKLVMLAFNNVPFFIIGKRENNGINIYAEV